MLYSDQNDQNLVMLTLAGEQRAYEVLVLRYEKAVIAAANSILHSRYMAEDAAQDAFITAWMKLNVLREPEKYGAWVCRIAKNCAKNMVARFRPYLSLDVIEGSMYEDDRSGGPEMAYVSSEEKELLHESISALPEKVKQVIYLHYFEGLSIIEIAERMNIPEGTVKWQLHDGRKRIRKDMCAVNEQIDDTLVVRVMKKVEELKLWQLKNSKDGFESVYRDVLAEVETLPESTDKSRALADVLMCGWWWVPGEKNDALLARIREEAERGRNEEVIEFVTSVEDYKVNGDDRIEFILNKQIPRLEAGGFKKIIGMEWLEIAYIYLDHKKDVEKARKAQEKTFAMLNPSDFYYALALSHSAMMDLYEEGYKDMSEKKFHIVAHSDEYRMVDGAFRFWKNSYRGVGGVGRFPVTHETVFRDASRCDGYFTLDGMAVGETYTGSDGTRLTFVSDSASAETACGTFDGCSVWKTEIVSGYDISEIYTYYKDGIGIVRQETDFADGMKNTFMLKSYTVVGGTGIIPCAAGNAWEYISSFDPEFLLMTQKISVCHADKKRVVVSSLKREERLQFDENSWLDMISQICDEYWIEKDGSHKLNDVSYFMERAEALASTPTEKAHTRALCSVMKRIFDTDSEFDPNCTEIGLWNFFHRSVLKTDFGKLSLEGYSTWHAEWKHWVAGSYPVLCNDIYGILKDGARCLWSDEWTPGTKYTDDFIRYGDHIKSEISCEDAGHVTVKAGSFDACRKISLDVIGMPSGFEYRGGRKDYYFAPGVGIIKIVNYYNDGASQAVYELTSYEGTGESYMPVADGMMRRFDAVNLTDGFVGSAEYAFVSDERGRLLLFEDRCGIKKKSDVTKYSSIAGEVLEEQLWNAGKLDESRLRNAVNNLRLLIHAFERPLRYWAMPEKAVEMNKYRMRLCEFLGDGGDVPRAWLGVYAASCFRAGCASFGCGRREDGYEYLERALQLYPKWIAIPDGEPLEVGNVNIFGDIKFVKGKGVILLPDGTREPADTTLSFDFKSLMYYGMTAPQGWEWFNGFREEERYKSIVERAKIIAETEY